MNRRPLGATPGTEATASTQYHCARRSRHDKSAAFCVDWLSLNANRQKSGVAVRVCDDKSATFDGRPPPLQPEPSANAEFAAFITIACSVWTRRDKSATNTRLKTNDLRTYPQMLWLIHDKSAAADAASNLSTMNRRLRYAEKAFIIGYDLR